MSKQADDRERGFAAMRARVAKRARGPATVTKERRALGLYDMASARRLMGRDRRPREASLFDQHLEALKRTLPSSINGTRWSRALASHA